MDEKIKAKPVTLVYGDVETSDHVAESIERMVVKDMIRRVRPVPPLVTPEDSEECSPESPEPITD